MAQDFAVRFYKSPAWERCRRAYLMEPIQTPYGIVPPGMCERCLMLGNLVPAHVVHHKEHLTPDNIDDPFVTLSFDNLQRLCQDCHAFVHSSNADARVEFRDGRAVMARDESMEAMVARLTATTDERRNIHGGGGHGRDVR